MTPEQLDEIEKLAVDFKSAAFHDLMARQALPLVKALREAQQMEAVSKAFHDVAVKERDYERVRANRIEQERDEARAYLADARSEAISVRATLSYQLEEARAEVERLRSVLRLLWEEATDEERCANERAPGCYSHALSQPTRKAVGAALKEGE